MREDYAVGIYTLWTGGPSVYVSVSKLGFAFSLRVFLLNKSIISVKLTFLAHASAHPRSPAKPNTNSTVFYSWAISCTMCLCWIIATPMFSITAWMSYCFYTAVLLSNRHFRQNTARCFVSFCSPSQNTSRRSYTHFIVHQLASLLFFPLFFWWTFIF